MSSRRRTSGNPKLNFECTSNYSEEEKGRKGRDLIEIY
jgi:hypothetical protein